MESRQVRRCGALAGPDGGFCWRVWAPSAKTVELVLLDEGRRRSCRMRTEEDGYFQHIEPESGRPAEGQRYAFRLTVFCLRLVCHSKKTVRNTVNLPGVGKANLPSALLIPFVIQTVVRSVCLRDQQCVSDYPANRHAATL